MATYLHRVYELEKHESKKYKKRPLSKISKIVVHHFAGDITIEEAAELHISKGWPGIGYWGVIDFDGSVHIVNDLDTVSYNVKNNNTTIVGIALRGDYSKKLPTSNMLEALDSVIKSLRRILGPLPVFVHSDFGNTECPGEMLRNYVKGMY